MSNCIGRANINISAMHEYDFDKETNHQITQCYHMNIFANLI